MTNHEPTPTPEPEPQPTQTPEPEPQPTPTPEPIDAYKTIIEQKDAQINALINQTNALTEQITKMISSGVQINDGTKAPEPQPQQGNYGFAKDEGELFEGDDLSVSALGNLIGKR